MGFLLCSNFFCASAEEVNVDTLLQEIEAATKRKTPNYSFSYSKSVEINTEKDLVKRVSTVELLGSEDRYYWSKEDHTSIPGVQYDASFIGERITYKTPNYYLDFAKDTNQIIISFVEKDMSVNVRGKPYWENLYSNVGLSYYLLNDEKIAIHDCQKDMIGSDSIIRISMTKTTISSQKEYIVLTVLPEKGYRLKSEYVFIKGVLRRTLRFDDYKDFGQGNWVPSTMHRINFSKNVNDEELDAIFSTQDLGQLEHIDLKYIKASSRYMTEHTNITFSFLDVLNLDDLDFVIPSGAKVYNEQKNRILLPRHTALQRDVKASNILSEINPISLRRFLFLLSQMKVLLFIISVLVVGMLILARFVYRPQTSPEVELNEETSSF